MRRGGLLLVGVAVGVAMSGSLLGACWECPPGPLDPLESGDYVVTRVNPPDTPPGFLLGASVHIDAEQGFVTFVYTRDGSTFDVRFDAAPG